MSDRERRVYPLGRTAAMKAAPPGVRRADNRSRDDSGDVTIEVWSSGAESAKPRTSGFSLRLWAPLAAAAGFIATSLILLTRRRKSVT